MNYQHIYKIVEAFHARKREHEGVLPYKFGRCFCFVGDAALGIPPEPPQCRASPVLYFIFLGELL